MDTSCEGAVNCCPSEYTLCDDAYLLHPSGGQTGGFDSNRYRCGHIHSYTPTGICLLPTPTPTTSVPSEMPTYRHPPSPQPSPRKTFPPTTLPSVQHTGAPTSVSVEGSVSAVPSGGGRTWAGPSAVPTAEPVPHLPISSEDGSEEIPMDGEGGGG